MCHVTLIKYINILIRACNGCNSQPNIEDSVHNIEKNNNNNNFCKSSSLFEMNVCSKIIRKTYYVGNTDK